MEYQANTRSNINENSTSQAIKEIALGLTLDGGGIKGYTSLLILQRLMLFVSIEEVSEPRNEAPTPEELRSITPALPHEYFDYIVGTSTGGLIAIMLGRLHLTVEECIHEYDTFAHKIFARPRRGHVRSLLWLPRSKFDCRELKKFIQDVIKHHKYPNTANSDNSEVDRGAPWKMFSDPPLVGRPLCCSGTCDCFSKGTSESEATSHSCKTAVIATKKEYPSSRAWFIRSYIHENTLNLDIPPGTTSTKYEIWEVARATSAAPGYFKPLIIEGEEKEVQFMDGGLEYNNPSLLAFYEMEYMAKNTHATRNIELRGCLVSIGCGISAFDVFPEDKQWPATRYIKLLRAFRKIATDTEKAHKDVKAATDLHQFPYYRFNVDKGLEKVMLDDWGYKRREFVEDGEQKSERLRTFEYFRRVTLNYLEQPNVKEKMRDCAKLLVRYHRQRREVGYM
ncbi:hypothetical protein BP5796_04341 [Coleophoma crateriformis]|uniref:PNPLA domain-containing protein n=1 Tax=Coleophoma crateriformis TaxID=565419 RepID=A0A3D8SI85_9HELO|nr:hypothetical protein BP5796_04341 [Coleophoma crateriformis]